MLTPAPPAARFRCATLPSFVAGSILCKLFIQELLHLLIAPNDGAIGNVSEDGTTWAVAKLVFSLQVDGP
jgi:hypothetical protein